MNEYSSRSHTILTVNITSEQKVTRKSNSHFNLQLFSFYVFKLVCYRKSYQLEHYSVTSFWIRRIGEWFYFSYFFLFICIYTFFFIRFLDFLSCLKCITSRKVLRLVLCNVNVEQEAIMLFIADKHTTRRIDREGGNRWQRVGGCHGSWSEGRWEGWQIYSHSNQGSENSTQNSCEMVIEKTLMEKFTKEYIYCTATWKESPL